jgi:hypothetical protein
MCAEDPQPPGGGECPQACTSCNGDTCVIECIDGGCDSQDIVCPEELACLVICEGVDSCDSGTITCPPTYACEIQCGGGNDACGDQQIQCGEASCSIDCEADACSGATVQCGDGPCTASCGGEPVPTLDCGNTCECNEC